MFRAKGVFSSHNSCVDMKQGLSLLLIELLALGLFLFLTGCSSVDPLGHLVVALLEVHVAIL